MAVVALGLASISTAGIAGRLAKTAAGRVLPDVYGDRTMFVAENGDEPPLRMAAARDTKATIRDIVVETRTSSGVVLRQHNLLFEIEAAKSPPDDFDEDKPYAGGQLAQVVGLATVVVDGAVVLTQEVVLTPGKTWTAKSSKEGVFRVSVGPGESKNVKFIFEYSPVVRTALNRQPSAEPPRQRWQRGFNIFGPFLVFRPKTPAPQQPTGGFADHWLEPRRLEKDVLIPLSR